MAMIPTWTNTGFYDNSILSGTKIRPDVVLFYDEFYDNSILSGTKIELGKENCRNVFYDNSILSGTKIPHTFSLYGS